MRAVPDAGVVDWLRRHEREIAVDPIILGEVPLAFCCWARAGSAPGSSAGSTPASDGCTVCHGKRQPA
jgi:hypothetical protein